jgi:hypothetical protein
MMHKVIQKRRRVDMESIDKWTQDQRTESKGRIAIEDAMLHMTKTCCTISMICLKRKFYIWLKKPGSNTGVKLMETRGYSRM